MEASADRPNPRAGRGAAPRRPTGKRRVGPLAPLLALLLATGSANAQEVKGTALEASAGDPIEGAFISLVDEAGAEITSALTSATGSFVLHAFERGSYRLRVERIGFETWISEPFEAGPGRTVTRSLRVPVRPVDLTELHVAVESRCSPRGTAGAELLRVWEEARKALQVTRWAEVTESIRFELRRWNRVLEPNKWRVESEESERISKTGRASFVSLPAARLAADGYVQRDERDAFRFYGPDADVLLSDIFLEDHCLSVIPGDKENPGLVGLAFEPAGGSDVPDVEGVLWLDPVASELRHMEFEYTRLDAVELRGDPWAGGRVEFRRAPGGAWFVSRWWIRIPVLHQGTRATLRRGVGGNFLSERLSTTVEAYREVGGEVVGIGLPDGRQIAMADWGTVVGRASDAVTDAPLIGARVSLVGTGHQTRTDSVGRFRLDFVSPGGYTVAVEHPDSRLRGIRGAEREVHLEGQQVARVSLEFSSARVAAAACEGYGGDDPAGGGAVLLGRVHERDGGAPVPRAVVWLRDRDGADARTVQADSAGSFLVCGLQPSARLEVQAASRGRVGEPAALEIPASGLLLRDLEVAPVTVAEASGELEAGATLRGVVKSADTGEPVAGARVRVLGSELERVTGDDGTFLMPAVPLGPQRVVTEYLGMTSDTATVDLTGGTVSVALLTLETRPVPLPALNVEIERTIGNLRLAGFYERMDRGLGDFITREDLEARDVVANLRRVQGVRIEQCVRRGTDRVTGVFGGAGQDRVGDQPGSETAPQARMRVTNCWEIEIGRRRSPNPDDKCYPLVFLNGAPIGGLTDQLLARFEGENPLSILAAIPPDMFEGIEVHRNAATAPAQYRGFGAGCGVIIAWTRGRG